MKLRPMPSKLIVRRAEAEKQSKGGLFLPDNAKEKPKCGVVLSHGPGRMLENGTRDEIPTVDGKTVYFRELYSSVIMIGDEEFLAIDQNDVLAIVDEEDPEEEVEERLVKAICDHNDQDYPPP